MKALHKRTFMNSQIIEQLFIKSEAHDGVYTIHLIHCTKLS